MKSKVRVTATITFEVDGKETKVSKTFDKPMRTSNPEYASNWMSRLIFMQCEKELFYPDHREKLPDVSAVGPRNKSTNLGHFDPDTLAAWENTFSVWMELENSLLDVEHMMGQFRAFRDLEKVLPDDVEEYAQTQLEKIHCLNEAILRLTKIEDLFLLLLFVNSGATLLKIDTSKPEWENNIRKKDIKSSLNKRSAIPYLAKVKDEEYKILKDVFSKFFSHDGAAYARSYRDQIAHRFQPAVDRADFYSELRFPIKVRTKGRTVISYGFGGKARVKYSSEILFKKMKGAVEHYTALLTKLKTIPGFDI